MRQFKPSTYAWGRIDHGGDGGHRDPQNFGVRGTLMQIVLPDFVIFFRILISTSLALQCSKVLPKLLGVMAVSQISTKITQYGTLLYLFKVQRITISGGNSTFFWRGQGQKYRSEFTPKYAFTFTHLSPQPSLLGSPKSIRY